MNLTAAEIMTSELITVRVADDLVGAYQKMKREEIRHLPVVDEKNNIVGIISDRDFQRAMGPMQKFKTSACVGDYMSSPVRTVSTDTDLITVINTIIDEKISAVLIAKNNKLTGIVTCEDLLMVLRVFLKKPPSVKDRVAEWTYNSPIGQVASFLSNAGI